MSSSTGKHRLLLPLAFLTIAAPTAGCRDTARAAGTAIFVNVSFDAENLPLTQLRFSATSDGQSLFEPVLRPDTAAAGPLPSGQSLRIRLPDSLGGQLVTVGAEGMNGSRVVSLAHSDVHVRRDFEIEVDLVLAAASEPACGPCMGCCSDMVCITAYSPLNCGSDLLCTRCDPSSADNCAAGECRCGSGPACSKAADRCVEGECRCGAGVPCSSGQECVNGQCTCTSKSCPKGCCAGSTCLPKSSESASACGAASLACEQCNAGVSCNLGVCSDCPAGCPDGCCSGNTCVPRGVLTCGNGGSACVACDPITTDGCNVQGLCACGTGLACGPGQHCVSGACVCDAVSCPSGCCQNNVCETSTADAGSAALRACGKNGRACTTCSPIRSDSCTSTGQCACGANFSCGVGQKCVNGSCVCDSATCSGCCSPDGRSCVQPGTQNDACGKNGFTCQNCGTQTCADGRCSSCTSATCIGCCSGSACLTVMPGPCPLDGGLCPCGQGGSICHSCATITTDTCNADGTCSCGAQPACSPGQHCINGQCFCDSTSCPTGCCSNSSSCVQPSLQQCGTNGSSCFACSPTQANNCSSTGACRCGSAPACPTDQRCTINGCH